MELCVFEKTVLMRSKPPGCGRRRLLDEKHRFASQAALRRDTAWAMSSAGHPSEKQGLLRTAGPRRADYVVAAADLYAPMVFTLTVNGCGLIATAPGLQASK